MNKRIVRVDRITKQNKIGIIKDLLLNDFNNKIMNIFDYVIQFYRKELDQMNSDLHSDHINKINRIKSLKSQFLLICKTNPIMPLESGCSYFVSYSELISEKKIDTIIQNFQCTMDEVFGDNKLVTNVLEFIIHEIKTLQTRASEHDQNTIWNYMFVLTDLSLKYSLLINSGYYKFLEVYDEYIRFVS